MEYDSFDIHHTIEIYTAIICGSLGVYFIIKELLVSKSNSSQLRSVQQLIAKNIANPFDFQSFIRTNKLEETVLFEPMIPKIRNGTFEIAYSKRLQPQIAKFDFYQQFCYERMIGIYRQRQKEYRIECFLNEKPLISKHVVEIIKERQSRKAIINPNKEETIAILGKIRYRKDQKQFEIITRFIGMNSSDIMLYWKKRIFHSQLVCFLSSILLGISLRIILANTNTFYQIAQQISNKYNLALKDKVARKQSYPQKSIIKQAEEQKK